MDINFIGGTPPSQMLEDDPPGYSPYDFHDSPPVLTPVSPDSFRDDFLPDSPDADEDSPEDTIPGSPVDDMVASGTPEGIIPDSQTDITAATSPGEFSMDSPSDITSDITSGSPDDTVISAETINLVTEAVNVVPWQDALNDMTPVYPNTVFSFESDNEDLDEDDKEMVSLSGHSFDHGIDEKDDETEIESQSPEGIVECESATENPDDFIQSENSLLASAPTENPSSPSFSSSTPAPAIASSADSSKVVLSTPASSENSSAVVVSAASSSTIDSVGALDLTSVDPTAVFPDVQPGVPQGPRFGQPDKSASHSLMNIVSLLTNKAQSESPNNLLPESIPSPENDSKPENESGMEIMQSQLESKTKSELGTLELLSKIQAEFAIKTQSMTESEPKAQTEIKRPKPVIKIKQEPIDVEDVNNNIPEESYAPTPKRKRFGYKIRPHHRGRVRSGLSPAMPPELTHYLNLAPIKDTRSKSLSPQSIPIHVGNGQQVPIDYSKLMETTKPTFPTPPPPQPQVRFYPHTPSPPRFQVYLPLPRQQTPRLQSPAAPRIQAHYRPTVPILEPPQQQEPLCLTIPKPVPASNQPTITVPISPQLNLTIPVTADLLRKLAIPALASLSSNPDTLQQLILSSMSNSTISPETLQQFATPQSVPTSHATIPSVHTPHVAQSVPTVHAPQPISVPTAHAAQPGAPTMHATRRPSVSSPQATRRPSVPSPQATRRPSVSSPQATRPSVPLMHIKQEPGHEHIRKQLLRPASLARSLGNPSPLPFTVPPANIAKPIPQIPPKFMHRHFSYPGVLPMNNPIALSTASINNRYASDRPPTQPPTPSPLEGMPPHFIASQLGSFPSHLLTSPLGTLPPRLKTSNFGSLPPRLITSPSGSLPPRLLTSPSGSFSPRLITSPSGSLPPRLITSPSGSVTPRLITSPPGSLPSHLITSPSGSGPFGTLPPRPIPSPSGSLPPRTITSPLVGSMPPHPIQSPSPSENSSAPPTPSPITSPTALVFEEENEDSGQVYRCDDCFRTFKHRLSLTNHQRAHGSKQPHICFLCKEPFKYKTNLKRHLRIHARQMRMCKYCHSIMDSDYDLVQHEKEHRRVLSAKDAEAIAIELENRLINGTFHGTLTKPESEPTAAAPKPEATAAPDSTTSSV